MSTATAAPVETGADPLVTALAQRIRQTIDKEGADALSDADRDFNEFWQTSTARSDDERRLLTALADQTKAGLVGSILMSVRPGSTAVEFNNAMQAMLDQFEAESADSDESSSENRNVSRRQIAARIAAALFLAGGADAAMTNALMARVNAEAAAAAVNGNATVVDNAIRNGKLGNELYGQPNTAWNKHDFTGSLHAFTSLGSIWLNSDRRVKIYNIHRQRLDNITSLKYGVVLLVMSIVFVVMFHAGLFSGAVHIPMIVLCVLALAAIAALAVRWFKTKPYNNLNGGIAVIYAVWAIYALSVVLW